MATSKTRAEKLLENFDDVITGLMTQMDTYAQQSGGYINRMHPDQFKQDGSKKDSSIQERRSTRRTATRVPKRRR